VQYVLSDVQGSSRTVMNNNGAGTSTVVARHDYLPFGQELGSLTGLRSGTQGYGASDTNRQKYGLTERDDATGLDHTGWRKYESTAGRWTSPDPLAGSLADPQSFNRYAYTQNDPVNFTDSSGLNVDSSEGDGYCIRYHYTNRSTGASFWGTWTCFPGSGAGGAGGEAGVGGKGVRGKRQDFKNFLKTMSQECKDALKGLPGNVIGKLSKLANTAKVYNVDNLQNARASRYVDEMAQRRETLGQWFDRSAPPGGAYSVVRVPRTGIYTRGGEGTFAGQFYFMLHEMTHLAYYNTRVDTDLDRYLARGLGLTKGSDESWSATVSRFFNSKCTEKGP
jgi:RHS repeat-associated protein